MATKKTSIATAKDTTVTVKQVAEALAEKHELTKKQGNEIIADFSEMLTSLLKKGNRVRWSGMGTMEVKKRAARKGRNPATGETIKIAASKKVAFRASKELKEAVGATTKKKK